MVSPEKLPGDGYGSRDPNESMDDRSAGADDDWRRTWHAIRDLFGSKWAFHVLRSLATEEHGFNDLKRDLDGVTAKTLSERLRELRCLGFVEREVHTTSPPTTTYRLTDAGNSLAAIMGDVESLIEVAECPDRDCPVPTTPNRRCAC